MKKPSRSLFIFCCVATALTAQTARSECKCPASYHPSDLYTSLVQKCEPDHPPLLSMPCLAEDKPTPVTQNTPAPQEPQGVKTEPVKVVQNDSSDEPREDKKEDKQEDDKVQEAEQKSEQQQEKEKAEARSPAPAHGYQVTSNDLNPSSSDRCAFGATVNGKYSCNGTETTIGTAQGFNTLSQIAGQAATRMMGQSQFERAQDAGTQSAAMDAAGDTQINVGHMQEGIGAINAAFGAYQLHLANAHNRAKKRINAAGRGALELEQGDMSGQGHEEGESGYIKSRNKTTQAFVQQFDLNQKGDLIRVQDHEEEALRKQGEKEKLVHVQGLLKKATTTAANEQGAIAKEAKAGGVGSLIVGTSQIIQGAFAVQAGERMKAAAAQLKDAENKVPSTFSFAIPHGDMGGQQVQGAGGGAVIYGNGDTATGKVSEQIAMSPVAPFNDRLGYPIAPGGIPADPLAKGPDTKPGAGNPAPILGNPGNLAGGTTAPGGIANDSEARAKYAADLGAASSQYSIGGGGIYSANGVPSNHEPAIPDLSGMVDQLMKRGGAGARFEGKPAMSEFGRMPASGPYSYLDRSVDLFARIHQAYQAKSKAGRLR